MHRRIGKVVFLKEVLFLIIIAVLLVIFVFDFITFKSCYRYRTAVQKNDKPDVTFSVLSDIHGNADKFGIALSGLYDINCDMDLLILNGDLVDQGLEGQYKTINKSLLKYKDYIPNKIIKNIGNHEFYDYKKGVNNSDDVNTFVNRYLKFAGVEKVYHDTWVNDYHFISLGSEICHTKELGPAQAFISGDQQNWLRKKLKERFEKGKPIFVFLHQPLCINMINSLNSYRGVKQNEEIEKILSEYPEVCLFTSHTHSSLRYSNIIRGDSYTSIHTGAVRNPLEPKGNSGRRRIGEVQGLYVEVYKNKVIIRGRDFKSNTWICGPFEI